MRLRIALLATVLLACAAAVTAQDRARTVEASHGSKIYINTIQGLNGFENYLAAAFKKKKVDLMVVADRAQADFEVTGYAAHQRAGWAKIIFGSGLPESEASIQVINVRTSVIAYAVGSYKVDALNGKKSTAEHLAKNLRQKMERDDRRLLGK